MFHRWDEHDGRCVGWSSRTTVNCVVSDRKGRGKKSMCSRSGGHSTTRTGIVESQEDKLVIALGLSSGTDPGLVYKGGRTSQGAPLDSHWERSISPYPL